MQHDKYDFQIVDRWHNGEFLTYAKLILIVDGQQVETIEYHGSSEFPGEDAQQQAASYAWTWKESMERADEAERLGVHPLEIAFAPFGPEWQRERDEEGLPF